MSPGTKQQPQFLILALGLGVNAGVGAGQGFVGIFVSFKVVTLKGGWCRH